MGMLIPQAFRPYTHTCMIWIPCTLVIGGKKTPPQIIYDARCFPLHPCPSSITISYYSLTTVTIVAYAKHVDLPKAVKA